MSQKRKAEKGIDKYGGQTSKMRVAEVRNGFTFLMSKI